MPVTDQFIRTQGTATNLKVKSETANAGAGELWLSNHASRTGAVRIGHGSSSGNITIHAGSGDLELSGANVTVSGDLNANEIQGVAATDNIALYTDTTSGTVDLATNASRSAAITIGNSSSSGNITLDAGSGTLTLGGSNFVEFGSWTPEFRAGGGAFTHTNQTGKYERIGKIVFINFNVTYSSLNAQSGNLTIAGLPPSPQNDGDVESGIHLYEVDCFQHGVTAGKAYGIIDANDTNVYLRVQTEGSTAGTWVNLTHNELDASGTIQGQGFYWTD